MKHHGDGIHRILEITEAGCLSGFFVPILNRSLKTNDKRNIKKVRTQPIYAKAAMDEVRARDIVSPIL